jgi:hypothetical protein
MFILHRLLFMLFKGTGNDTSGAIMKPITIAPIYCPLPVMQHPAIGAVERPCREWLRRWELFPSQAQRERLGAMGVGRLCEMIYPDGPQQTLQIATDYMMWTFAYDDELCDEGPASENPSLLIEASSRIQRILESPEAAVDPADRYGMALLDIRRRLLSECEEKQAARFSTLMRTYFMAEMWKAVAAQPSLNDYMPQRLMGGGGMTFPFFCHAVPQLDLDERELADRRIVALTEMAAMFAVWDNDIFSWPKEVFRSQNKKGHNLIEVIGREYRCSVEEALGIAVDMRERVQGLYLRLHEHMLDHVSAPMRRYLLGLNAYISGVLQWHRITPRFRFINGVDGPECLYGGEPATQPRSLGIEPLAIASIAWWWQYDPAAKERWSEP